MEGRLLPWQMAYLRAVYPACARYTDENLHKIFSPSSVMFTTYAAQTFRKARGAQQKIPPRAGRLAFRADPSLVIGRGYSTVRVGSKWLLWFVQGDRRLAFLDGAGEVFGFGEAVRVCYVPASEVPEDWRVYDPERDRWSLDGLLSSLRAKYGKEVNPDTMVSVLFFRLTGG